MRRALLATLVPPAPLLVPGSSFSRPRTAGPSSVVGYRSLRVLHVNTAGRRLAAGALSIRLPHAAAANSLASAPPPTVSHRVQHIIIAAFAVSAVPRYLLTHVC